MIKHSNLISGFNLPNINYSREYGLDSAYEATWAKWLNVKGKQNFAYSIPTNGIVESIEKICSCQEYTRFVIVRGEVEFYKMVLRNHSKEFIIIEPNDWGKLREGDLICLSMPFSALGEIPDWYQNLCDHINGKNIDMFIDGAYLGTLLDTLYIPTNCKFFAVSVSKCFNASALRAGILFCDNIISNFKQKYLLKNYNYTSMKIAIKLLNQYDSKFIPTQYKNFQLHVCNTLNLTPAKSVLLGYTNDLTHPLRDEMNLNKDLNIFRYSIPKALMQV